MCFISKFFNRSKYNILNKNSVFFITGCSSGFGKSLATVALERGYKVVATARKLIDLEYLEKNVNLLKIEMDVKDSKKISDAVNESVKKFGKIDVLINNAGINYNSTFLDGDEEKVKNIFETNVWGALNVTKKILPHMQKNKFGRIVNISSQSGYFYTLDAFYYSLTKYTLEGFTTNLNAAEINDNIRAISVNPGVFKTDIVIKSMNNTGIKYNDYSNYDTKRCGNADEGAKQIIESLEKDDYVTRIILGQDALKKFKKRIKWNENDLKYNKNLVINKKQK